MDRPCARSGRCPTPWSPSCVQFPGVDADRLDVEIVGLVLAQQILLDAEYNSDRRAQDVGEYGMPLPIFNAYRALARQTRAAIAAENSGTT